MPTSAADIVNQALDVIGAKPISEMRDGSREANAALRHYVPRVRDLLRSVHWNFARKQVPLVLAKDRTSIDPRYPTTVPMPWLYEYLYPTDCEKLRFIPQSGSQTSEDPPLMTNLAPLATVSGSFPAPFVLGTDIIVPNDTHAEGPGVRVVLTNVKAACAVYTVRAMNPELWDSLFEAAAVGLLAAWLAMPCLDDPKQALEIRAQQIALVRELIGQARTVNGNEGWTTADHLPDWIRVRGAGHWPYGTIGANASGLGALTFETLGFPDGSAY